MKKLLLILWLLPSLAFADDLSKIIYAENRIGYGSKLSEQQSIRQLGLDQWIEEQLKGNQDEPDFLQNRIADLSISKVPVPAMLNQIKAMKQDSEDNKKIVRTLQAQWVYETFERDALRALYSKNQLRERMTWFWFNHFNVDSQKGMVKDFLADYQENVIHKNALGNFKDLLRATLKSPSMSFYLDNYQNTAPDSLLNQKNQQKNQSLKGINENYAREIMELHTLGQGQGYTQQDVQELARILTGFGFRRDTGPVNIRKDLQPMVVTDGLFFFDPRRHDFGDKLFMGHTIIGSGYPEIEQVLDILVNNPNTAKNICRELAVYFVDDQPSKKLLNKMTATFLKTHGDIPSTLRVIFKSEDFWSKVGKNNKFKMPHEYVYSAIRLAYDDIPVTNLTPLWNQISNMGETPYGHQTPDGYGISNKDWVSPDQMEKRFTFSNLFNYRKTNLLNDDEYTVRSNLVINKSDATADNQPKFENPVDYEKMMVTIGGSLSDNTKAVLQDAKPKERIGYLLASPEMLNK